MYLIYSISCDGCNVMGILVKNEEPSKELIKKIEEDLGGMYCLKSKVIKVNMNELVKLDLY